MSFQATKTYVAMSCLATYYFARFYWARAIQRLRDLVATWFPGLFDPTTIRGVWVVKQALLFREGEESEDGDSMDFVSLPRSLIDFDRPDFLEFVDQIAPNDWDSWKLELRCQATGCRNRAGKSKKKRIVVRHGEPFRGVQVECNALSNTIIIGAFFLSDRTDTTFTTKQLDITPRIKKYVLSPDRELLCQDLFPMDDPESWLDGGDDGDDVSSEIKPRLPGILVHGWSPSGSAKKSGYTFTEILRMDQSLRDVLHF